jgi:hypothetical protein
MNIVERLQGIVVPRRQTAIDEPPRDLLGLGGAKVGGLTEAAGAAGSVAEAGDLDGLEKVEMLPPRSTSPKQLLRYRDAAALKARKTAA